MVAVGSKHPTFVCSIDEVIARPIVETRTRVNNNDEEGLEEHAKRPSK